MPSEPSLEWPPLLLLLSSSAAGPPSPLPPSLSPDFFRFDGDFTIDVVRAQMECVSDVTLSLRGTVAEATLCERGESAPPGDRSWPDPLDWDMVSRDWDPGKLQNAFITCVTIDRESCSCPTWEEILPLSYTNIYKDLKEYENTTRGQSAKGDASNTYILVQYVRHLKMSIKCDSTSNFKLCLSIRLRISMR